jgi:hypothetical protein
MKSSDTKGAAFEAHGTFTDASGTQVFGKLVVAGSDSSLSLWHSDWIDTRAPINGVLYGTLHDSTKVTLVDCIAIGSTSGGSRPGNAYYGANFFPHFVLAGTRHIDPATACIEEVTFFVQDAHVLFNDFDAFGSVVHDRELLKEILRKRGVKRRVRTGKYPWIMYFTGKHDIISLDTALGRVTATHCPTGTMGGATGVGLQSRVGISIRPSKPVPFEEILTRLVDLQRLLTMLIGRPQRLEEAWVLVRRRRGDGPIDQRLRMNWSHADTTPSAGTTNPHPGDVLISPIRDPRAFKEVVTKWLQMDAERKDARGRFSSSFAEGNSYGVNRIVGAANMFDILPAGAVPLTNTLSAEVKAARDLAKSAFKALPPTDEREALLQALSRLGTATLRRKILHRADIVTREVGKRFPQMDTVIREAVRCRNHYVHGSPSKVDYSTNVNALAFLVGTLEFVFAASELVEAGWDIASWCDEMHGGGHPFGDFKSNYALGLSELEKLLTAAATRK